MNGPRDGAILVQDQDCADMTVSIRQPLVVAACLSLGRPYRVNLGIVVASFRDVFEIVDEEQYYLKPEGRPVI